MVSQLCMLPLFLLAVATIYVHIVCIVLTCAVYYHIAENIGGHKIWRICYERYLAGFKFGGFRFPWADDVTKWLP